MSIKSQIQDGYGTGNKARVFDGGELFVTQDSAPPLIPQKIKPYSEFLKSEAGSFDMRTVGTLSSPVKYYISANNDSDIYITSLSFVIADAGATLNEFGSISALTNGCRLYYTYENEEIVIADNLISNFTFVRMCQGNPTFGTGSDAFRARNVSGGSEAFIPILDTTKIMPPYGIKIGKGSSDKLILEVRDNTTKIDAFNCRLFGFERF